MCVYGRCRSKASVRFTTRLPSRVIQDEVRCTPYMSLHGIMYICRLHDRKCKGYIKRADFVRVLESLAPPTSKEAIETLTNSIQDSDNGLIPYPRFLALFDGPTVTNRPLTSSAAAVHHEHEDMSSLKQKISEVFRMSNK